MSIFTIGNKPISYKTTYTDPYYKEWLADTTSPYPIVDSLEECNDRYLCFTCDFITNSGSSSDFDSEFFCIKNVGVNTQYIINSLLFRKVSSREPEFGNFTIQNVDLTVKNNIKYVFDLNGNKYFFFLNGVLIGHNFYDGYIREVFTVHNTQPGYIRPVFGKYSTVVTTSNAKVFHCDTFDVAESWVGGAVGAKIIFAVNGVNLS